MQALTKQRNQYNKTRKGFNIMNKTTTTKQGNQAINETTENAFATLLRNYEQATRQGNNDNELIELATACAYSVLKKCIDVSYNPQLVSVKRDIARDNNHLQAIHNASYNAFSLAYNQDGDLIQAINDKSLAQAFDKLASVALGDGLDLVNSAIVAILEETEKTSKQGAFMEECYTVRQLKRKVYIQLEDSANGWETVETMPIRQVFKAVRHAIDTSRAMSTDARNGYTYLEDYATDTETDTEQRIYRRLPKYADLGGHATDYNGQETLYSADRQTVEDIDTLIAQLELTVRQAKVLQLRLQGYGQKAIATYLGVSKQAIQKTLGQIQTKATSNGLQPK